MDKRLKWGGGTNGKAVRALKESDHYTVLIEMKMSETLVVRKQLSDETC